MTDRKLDFDGHEFILTVSPREIDRAKSIPGMRFRKADETWHGPALLSAAHTIRGVFGDDIEITPAARTACREEAQRARDVQAAKDGGVPDKDEYHGVNDLALLDHQRIASELAAEQSLFMVGDEKGVGKTPQAICALRRSGEYPALVVATNSMKHKWAEEFGVWAPEVTAVVAGRTAKERLAAIVQVRELAEQNVPAVLIMGWSQLIKHSALASYGSFARTDAEKKPKELNGDWLHTVIADEAHKMKDPKAKQTLALKGVAHAPGVVNRWPLTATPIANNTLDLWSVLNFMSPERWPSRSQFRDRYVLTYQNHWGGVEDLGLNPATEPEFRKIFDPHYIRRPLSVNVQLLPVEYRMLDMEPKQRTAYEKFRKDMILNTETGMLVATNPLTLNAYLQQLAAATPVLNDEGRIIELTAPSCKVEALVDLLGEMGGEPLVVFAESRKLIELCYRELTKGKSPVLAEKEIGLVTGKVSDRDRHAYIKNFQAGNLPLIMLTYGAGSEGITLTRANTMACLNRSYKMVSNNQADGRLFRTGQTRDVQIIEFVTRGTVEAKVHEATGGKEELLQQLVKDPGWVRRHIQ